MRTSLFAPRGLALGLALLSGASVGLGCKGAVSNPAGQTGSGGMDPTGPVGGSAGAPGTTGASGVMGTGGVADPGPAPGPIAYEAVAPASYTAKVKTLLTGLPPTAAELAAVTADPKALRGLLDQWMALPEFQTKMLLFFRNAFQQSQVDGTTTLDQLGGRGLSTNGQTNLRLYANLQESFPRTAWQLVAGGQPFNGTVQTTQHQMTTAMAAFLAFLDDRYVDDAGRTASRWVKATTPPPPPKTTPPTPALPGLTVTASSDLTITMADSLNPASPSYLKFSTGMAMPACANPERSFTKEDAPFQLFSILMGHVDSDKTITDNLTCKAFNIAPAFTDADFTDWHAVNVRAPKPGEATTKFYDVASLRGVKELVLNVPRVGFFSTPAFFANWSTNTSNLFRVTMNQTLIVGLGHSFDGTNATTPVSETGLDSEHAAPGSPCYGCHQTLDPMRQTLQQSYTLMYHEQMDPLKIAQTGVFTFAGVSRAASGAPDLAKAIAEHPMFAAAWAQKLCFYADSAPCSEDDAEFTRVVGVFAASHLNWKTLVRELFSSPLVTGAAHTKTFDDRGVPVSVARRDHWCGLLGRRLGINDPCGLSGLPGLTGAQNAVGTLARGLPTDGYSRGSEDPVVPSDTSLFFRSGTENVCRRIADQVVDVAVTATQPIPSRYVSTMPEPAITDFVQTLMGLPDGDPRAADARQILSDHYQAALKTTGIKAKDALKSTFVLACTAPSTIAVGL
ncbi:MAG: hypothetical protein JWM82_4068 [Myxococcales bacterium]|nr:hypothetical protein [Myxococcales bacterium]